MILKYDLYSSELKEFYYNTTYISNSFVESYAFNLRATIVSNN